MPYRDLKMQREAQHASYVRLNQATVAQRSKIARDRRREWFDDLKEGIPCVDCGGTFPPCVMDYHHIDEGQKVESLGRALSNWSKARLLEEIKKCELVCSNCHRIRHNKRI